ncbi:hypothetical protein HMPREF0490_02341 [Lachnospiraceae bacterium 6_1_37FAA]|nr:hypothetical protein HMPREF0490_02341 [Lachnospiraceae bacterium 6_1_37FAA]
MNFDKENFTVERIELDGITVEFRAFRNRIYVDKPVNPEFQQMNIFAPEIYFNSGSINGYTLKTAPIFMPNTVGGYMPGELGEPGYNKFGSGKELNSIFLALQHGYVVAAPAIRGRVQRNNSGKYTGKAPACIVDYKAAVRYLRFFAEEIPGDTEKIITNGTSAGGALSSLMGATGNHPDYEPYLREIGAASASDEIFAASCYCPITNLEHADMAYEWQFVKEKEFHRMKMRMEEGGRPAFTPEDGIMSDQQMQVAIEEAGAFPDYLNSLALRDPQGRNLFLDKTGNGTFKVYLERLIQRSAQKAMDEGKDILDKKWITVKNGKVISMEWDGYIKDITRMKTAPAFDSLAMDSPENDLFGTEEEQCRHFTNYSLQNSLVSGRIACKEIIKMMNPMGYIDDTRANTASYWRIRHGECDRDTSLAVSAMLAIKLQNAECMVDYHLPWNVPHAGDYDIQELFSWIDQICR